MVLCMLNKSVYLVVLIVVFNCIISTFFSKIFAMMVLNIVLQNIVYFNMCLWYVLLKS